MKIAVTSQGKDLNSQVDPRFGRAAYVIIVDSDTNDFKVIDNGENVNAMKGAGIQAASNVVNSGAKVLLTGFCGPNAYKALQAGKPEPAEPGWIGYGDRPSCPERECASGRALSD